MEQLLLFDLTNSTSSAEERPARISPLPESGLAASAEAERDPRCAGSGSTLSAICALGGSYGKTCRDVSALASQSTEATSPSSRLRLQNSGMVVRGALWTFSSPEWTHFQEPSHSVGGVCGLSDMLEPMETDADSMRLRKYFLSARACSGILRRAAARGKELPKALKDALEVQIAMWESGELERSENEIIDALDEDGDVNGDNQRDEGRVPDGGLPDRGGRQ